MSKFFKPLAVSAFVSLMTAGQALAVELVQQHNSSAVWFENWKGLTNATMTVVAPNGKIIKVFAEKGTPVFQLYSKEAQDGVYRYELSAATEEEVEIVNYIDNGRGENERKTKLKPFSMNGSFTVYRGAIITPEEVIEEKVEKGG